MNNVIKTTTIVTHKFSKDGLKFVGKEKIVIDIQPAKYMEMLNKSSIAKSNIPNGNLQSEHWSYNILTGVFHIRQHSEVLLEGKHIPEDGKRHFVEKGKYAEVIYGKLVFHKRKR